MNYAFRSLDTVRIFYPSYYCPSTLEAIRGLGYEMVEYPIGEDLLPKEPIPAFEAGDVILLVDFFGVRTEQVKELAYTYERVVLDFCHSFFAQPIQHPGAVCVYSCRKFLGVSDGAYAASYRELVIPDWPLDASYDRIKHLVGSWEQGTGAFYAESLESKSTLAEPRLMSDFTRLMLDSIDYGPIMQRRRDNYQELHAQLAELQELNVPEKPLSPWCYPLLTRKKKLRLSLVRRHVYVPRIWETWVDVEPQDTAEYLFSNYLVCLPIDQRYRKTDMRELARIVCKEWEDQ